MKNILLAALFLAALLVGSVAVGAFGVNQFYKNVAPSSCEELQLDNASSVWLPQKVSEAFMGDKVIFHFAMVNGNDITFSGVVEKGEIAHLRCGIIPDYDYEIWMSDADALELATSTKPVTTGADLWRSGQIKIRAGSPEDEKKFAYANTLVAEDDEPVPEWVREPLMIYINNTPDLQGMPSRTVPVSCSEASVNKSSIPLPEAVSDLFAGNRVVLHIDLADGSEGTVNGVVHKGMIAELHCGTVPDYDYEIWIDEGSAAGLASSQQPVAAFLALMENGKIRINANGAENQKKLADAGLALQGN
jgi:hypothetical protein